MRHNLTTVDAISATGWQEERSQLNEEDRVWALFDWDGEGWTSFVSDPDVPALLQAAGHVGKPQAAEILGRYNA